MSDLNPASSVSNQGQTTPFHFEKRNGPFFKLYLKTVLLTIITLGIYSFWGRVSITKFIYNNTSFGKRTFDYHATGKEMFIGFLKGILIVGVIAIAIFGLLRIKLFQEYVLLVPVYIAFFFVLIPYLIIGKWRFLLSRSSYCNVRFKFVGDFKSLLTMWIKSVLLTIVTVGLYTPVLQNKLQKYIADNSRFGTLAFGYNGTNKDYFKIWLKCLLLTICTLGIYSFWFTAKINRYIWSHTTLNGRSFNSTITGGGLFKLAIVNIIIVIFTLGFGFPIAVNRMNSYFFSNLTLDINPDELAAAAALFDKGASALASGIEEAANVVDAISGII